MFSNDTKVNNDDGVELKYGITFTDGEIKYTKLDSRGAKYKIIALLYYVTAMSLLYRLREYDMKKYTASRGVFHDRMLRITNAVQNICSSSNSYYTFFTGNKNSNGRDKAFLQDYYKELDLLATLIRFPHQGIEGYDLTIVQDDGDSQPTFKRNTIDISYASSNDNMFNYIKSFLLPTFKEKILQLYSGDKYVEEHLKQISEFFTEIENKKLDVSPIDFNTLDDILDKTEEIYRNINQSLTTKNYNNNGIEYQVSTDSNDDVVEIEINGKLFSGKEEILHANDQFIQLKKDGEYFLIDKISGACIVSRVNILDDNYDHLPEHQVRIYYRGRLYHVTEQETLTGCFIGRDVSSLTDLQTFNKIKIKVPKLDAIANTYTSAYSCIITEVQNGNRGIFINRGAFKEFINFLHDAALVASQIKGSNINKKKSQTLNGVRKHFRIYTIDSMAKIMKTIAKNKPPLKDIKDSLTYDAGKHGRVVDYIEYIQSVAKIGVKLCSYASKKPKIFNGYKESLNHALQDDVAVFFETFIKDATEFFNSLGNGFRDQKDLKDVHFMKKTNKMLSNFFYPGSPFDLFESYNDFATALKNHIDTYLANNASNIGDENQLIRELRTIKSVADSSGQVPDAIKACISRKKLIEVPELVTFINNFIDENNATHPDGDPKHITCKISNSALKLIEEGKYSDNIYKINSFAKNKHNKDFSYIDTEISKCKSTLMGNNVYTENIEMDKPEPNIDENNHSITGNKTIHDFPDKNKSTEYDVYFNTDKVTDGKSIKEVYDDVKSMEEEPNTPEQQQKKINNDRLQEKLQEGVQLYQQRVRTQQLGEIGAAISDMKDLSNATIIEKLINWIRTIFTGIDLFEVKYKKAYNMISCNQNVVTPELAKNINSVCDDAFYNMWSNNINRIVFNCAPTINLNDISATQQQTNTPG